MVDSQAGLPRIRLLAAVIVLATALPLRAQDVAARADASMDYATAKAAADVDEASLDTDASQRLHDAQAAFVDAATSACATSAARPDLSRFTVVMALDATGRVTRTWREGASPLSVCIEKQARSATLAAPPRQPFHAVIEISFTP